MHFMGNLSGYWINRTSYLYRASAEIIFKENNINITPEQWAMLGIIWSTEDNITVNEISLKTIKDKSTVSRGLNILEKRGFVKYIPNPNDGRSKFVTTTSEINKVKPLILKCIKRVIKIAEKGIDIEELDRARLMHEKIQNNLLKFLGESHK
jgi:DNA-binding MarR family transcriptional regulator